MTTAPFEPNPEFGKPRIAAADPGQGAPEQAQGFGVEAEEPDVTEDEDDGS
ncbi:MULTISPECIES: hypothetical protein [Saccharothrix]|uniref:hypothetical protein n=1 Tax=Saccharothrix TaxID=2071 RepID=UPI0018E9B234|nr:hypothetical protein [Saccharothrix sp. CB00851]